MNRDQLRDVIAEVHGEPFAVSYFDRSEFREGPPPTLRPWSLVAEERFKDVARRTLDREGVKLLPADPEHLKPKARRAT